MSNKSRHALQRACFTDTLLLILQIRLKNKRTFDLYRFAAVASYQYMILLNCIELVQLCSFMFANININVYIKRGNLYKGTIKIVGTSFQSLQRKKPIETLIRYTLGSNAFRPRSKLELDDSKRQ